MKRYLFFIILSCNLCYSQSGTYIFKHGTSVVAFIKKDSIWLAADSKVMSTIDSSIGKPTTVCKIDEFNNAFIAIAGTPSIIYEHKIFWDSYEEIKKQLKTGTSLQESYEILQKKLYDQLFQIYYSFIKNRSKKEVANLFSDTNKILLQVTLSGFTERNNAFHVNWLYYLHGTEGNWSIMQYIVHALNGDVNDLGDLTYFSFAGQTDSIQKFLTPSSEFFKNKMTPKQRLIFLIKLEICKNKNAVGKPINIVLINPHKHEWLTKNKVCKSVGKY